MNLTKVQKIALTGLLTALQIVLARMLGVRTPVMTISFSFVPLVLMAVLIGVLPTMLSAAAADFIGAILFPIGAYFPGFTLSAALTGLVFGMLLYKKPRKFWRVSLAALIHNGIISLLLGTYWLYIITGKGYLALLPSRLVQLAIMLPLQILCIWFVIYPVLPRLGKNFFSAQVKGK